MLRHHEKLPGPNFHRAVRRKLPKQEQKKKKRTKIIKATTRATTGMGEIREQIHRLTQQVQNFKMKSQASG